ncbi:hypothetical protein [Paraburkholderia xenovorans]|uniref:hypothetical protein n=1 Tax=Paraburkholderia xenovorans TaxID=36873 RepID=UPI0038B84DC6
MYGNYECNEGRSKTNSEESVTTVEKKAKATTVKKAATPATTKTVAAMAAATHVHVSPATTGRLPIAVATADHHLRGEGITALRTAGAH